MKLLEYTGGLAETNAYLVETAEGWLLVDAPEGVLDFVRERKIRVAALVLTHGHWDHIWDAADLVAWAQCPVYYHQDDELLITRPELMRDFGLPVDLKPVQATQFLKGGEEVDLVGKRFRILHVPGHCPGSICLYQQEEKTIFGGDVLFAGGVGRWDLPGGSRELLIEGIHNKLMVLPDEVIVYPGHGPATSIGQERRENPYL
ncbi:MAG: MBL fold metallo-hydrolase [Blastochloris sp.]|nr:MBL fold metallo-hydrolase [Blastochloris sp.]